MNGEAGKGCRRRPKQITDAEFNRRWGMAFHKQPENRPRGGRKSTGDKGKP